MPPRSRREVLRAGLTIATGLGLGLGGCRGPSRRFWNAGRPPNVVLVSIDTLRADRLHAYGNPRPTSPHLDALAREGVLFTNAFSTSSWTLPGHLALFTSTEPGKFFQSVVQFHENPFPIFYRHQRRWPTIASTLAEHGYDTVGTHGALLLDAIWGLDFGFREYTFAQEEVHFLQAIDYLKRAPAGDPFFLFVHTFVPHRPYFHESVFGDPRSRPPGLRQMDFEQDRLGGRKLTPLEPDAPLYGWLPRPEEIEYFKTVYDGGVWVADRLLRNLVRALHDTGRYDDTLLIVLSDHGEEFWDHIPECSPDHNHSLFDELLHIPLVIKFPGGRFAGTRVDHLCRIHDVGPTIFDVAGVALPGGASGRSLLPCIEDRETTARSLLAGQTYMGPSRICLRTETHKYVRCFETRSFKPYFEVPREALYDLRQDPGEQHDVADAQPVIAARMRDDLLRRRREDLPLSLALDDGQTRRFLPALGLQEHAEWLARNGVPDADVPDMREASPELRHAMEKLRALGYAN